MTIIDNYQQFSGIHWETGSVRNVLAHRGVIAPHTGEPFSEAMLLGLAGGITAMYFTFEYKGEDPHLFIGTRCTFDPLDKLNERAGFNAKFKETTSVNVARKHLVQALHAGQPAIVWADVHSLPYNGLEPQAYGYMQPVVVYGVDEGNEFALIADRAREPLTVSTGDLSAARAKQGSLKNRLVTLHPPESFEDFAGAVENGIRATLGLYLDKPPRGPASNFGLAALEKWADMLVDTRSKKGWPNLFWPGSILYGALKTAFRQIELEGTGGAASRPLYADFIDEAALVLGEPAIGEVADLFREAGLRWSELSRALLPDAVDVLAETRDLMVQRDVLFAVSGVDSLEERRAITARLDELDALVGADFPLDIADCHMLREQIREQVMAVYEAERPAVWALKDAMPA